MKKNINYFSKTYVTSNKNFVAQVLQDLGIEQPNQKQIYLIDMLVSSITFKKEVLFNKRLNEKETICLYFSAKGKTAAEIATLMSVKKSAVDWYKKVIIKKLECNNMAQAVFEGMRYGLILSAQQDP